MNELLQSIAIPVSFVLLMLAWIVLLIQSSSNRIRENFQYSVIGIQGVWSAFLLFQVLVNKATFVWEWVLFPDSYTRWFIRLEIDNISAVLYFLLSSVGSGITVYANSYFRDSEELLQFNARIVVFSIAMFILACSKDVFSFFIGYEWMGFASFHLISLEKGKDNVALSSLKAYLFNLVGDVVLLGCVLFVSVEMSGILFSDWSLNIATLPPALGYLIIIGLMAKAAQWPYSPWLRRAMDGPSPVSALMHSSTLVVAPVLLLIRWMSIFTEEHLLFIGVVGTFSWIWGSMQAAVTEDAKAALAYSSIAQIGVMWLAISINQPYLALAHLMVHAFSKASLFLSLGKHMKEAVNDASKVYFSDIDGISEERHFRFLSEWNSKNKTIWKWSTLLPICSMAGLPFTSMAITKESILHYYLMGENQEVSYIPLVIIVIGVFLGAYYPFRWWFFLYFEKDKENAFSLKTLLNGGVSSFLGLGGLFFFFSYSPFDAKAIYFISRNVISESHSGILLNILSVLIAFSGVLIAYWNVRNHNNPLRTLTKNRILSGSDIGLERVWTLIVHFFGIIANQLKYQTESSYGLENIWDRSAELLVFSSYELKKYGEFVMNRTPIFISKAWVVSGYLLNFVDRKIWDPMLSHTPLGFKFLFGSSFSPNPRGNVQEYLRDTVFWLMLALSVFLVYYYWF